jgi:hypothetical protein
MLRARPQWHRSEQYTHTHATSHRLYVLTRNIPQALRAACHCDPNFNGRSNGVHPGTTLASLRATLECGHGLKLLVCQTLSY